MTRRVLLHSSSNVLTALAVASLAGVLVPVISPTPAPTLAPTLAHERGRLPKPIVAIDRPAGSGDYIMHFLDVVPEHTGSSSKNFRKFLGFADVTTPNGNASKFEATSKEQRSIIVADADPYFERWQKDADERLKLESNSRTPKQHPLAAEHPEQSVIVCEAGCATTKDEIVYMAAYVQAVPPPRQLDPSSSGQMAPAGDSVAIEDGSLPCIAGCYDNPETANAAARHRAEIQNAPAARLTVAAAPKIQARVAKIRAASIAVRLRTRIQMASNGAIVEGRTAQRFAQRATPQRALKLAKIARIGAFKTRAVKARLFKASVLKASAIKPWRTKVIAAARPVHTNYVRTKAPALRAIKRTRTALRPMRYARANIR